jgi:dsRNA-specific ribonuclease
MLPRNGKEKAEKVIAISFQQKISCARNFENIKERAKAKLKEPCHGKTMVVKQYQIQWSQGNFISFQFYQCKSAN